MAAIIVMAMIVLEGDFTDASFIQWYI